MSHWISVLDRLPNCDKRPNSFGVPVLIWPHYKSEIPYAYYGCRVTDEPSFYLFGQAIDVAYWQELPKGKKP